MDPGNRAYGSPEERTLWDQRGPHHKRNDMRTCNSPEDDPGVVEDETVGALAGRSGVAITKTRQSESEKIYTAVRLQSGQLQSRQLQASTMKYELRMRQRSCATGTTGNNRGRTCATSGGWH